jgi:hypothetical protein
MGLFLESKIGKRFGHDLKKIPIPNGDPTRLENVFDNLQAEREAPGGPLANYLIEKTPMVKNKWEITRSGAKKLVVLKNNSPARKERLWRHNGERKHTSRKEIFKSPGAAEKDKDGQVVNVSTQLEDEVYCYNLVNWVQDPVRACSEYIEDYGEQSHDMTGGKLCTGEGIENRCVFGYLGPDITNKLVINQDEEGNNLFPVRTALVSSQRRDAITQIHRAIQFIQQHSIPFNPPESGDVFEYLTELEQSEQIGIVTLIVNNGTAPQVDARPHVAKYDTYCFIYLIYSEHDQGPTLTTAEPVIFFSITGTDILHSLPATHPILAHYHEYDKLTAAPIRVVEPPAPGPVEIDKDISSGNISDFKSSVETEDHTLSMDTHLHYNPYDIGVPLPTVTVTGGQLTPTGYLIGNQYLKYRNLYETQAPYLLRGRINTEITQASGSQDVEIEWAVPE